MKVRGSGILLHLTSLPTPYGIGDMGSGACRFVDFLADTKQSVWQILPLNPTDPEHGNSPYHSCSAFACNPLLISPELLVENGYLDAADLELRPDFPEERVDYEAVVEYKNALFQKAFDRFTTRKDDFEFRRFCSENAAWLDDYALFKALKSHFAGRVWSEWPPALRDRRADALREAQSDLAERIEKEKSLQFLFSRHWNAIREYCNKRNIKIFGDIPIYVTYDSADVWANPELFNLDDEKRPITIAGVPPDYFSATGQLWGNPVYRWDVLRKTAYDWWAQRIARNLDLFDIVRIDHFRGFVGYWEVPAGEATAIKGRWVEAPAMDFFTRMMRRFPSLPIIAEDLGTITPDVREMMHHFEFPGMKLLVFAFGEDLPTNPYIPHNLPRNCVAYTGTHDNNTIKGWFRNELSAEDKERLFRYLGREVPLHELHWELIRLVMMSAANVSIFPMQDILGLEEEARMNRPADKRGNWLWRLRPDMLSEDLSEKFREMTEIYGRA